MLITDAPHRPFDIVLFGGNGDLALRKLIPALYYRHRSGELEEHGRIISVAKTAMSREQYIRILHEAATRFIHGADFDEKTWQEFCARVNYCSINVTEPQDYSLLVTELGGQQDRVRVFYLATRSDLYGPICENLHAHQLITKDSRIVIEKPIGYDLASAREINDKVAAYFAEKQIFRIDHYLGKETVQNLLVLRFANPLFESQWNHHYIDNIQISIAESIGVENRANFYEKTGALRDMVQNHLLQLLCIIAMEPPANLDPDTMRDEKLKVLRCLRPIKNGAVHEKVVRGQYGAGVVQGQSVNAYVDEPDVNSSSQTETFVALKVEIDNLRWAGVPFYLKTGKRMPDRSCKIVVQFKEIAHSIFPMPKNNNLANKLVIQLQPNEGITLRLCGKRPGQRMDVRTVDLNLSADPRNKQRTPEAYERLLIEVIEGRTTLFVRHDELEAAWSWVEPILDEWQQTETPPDYYAAGTWGPASATFLLAKDGRLWDE